MAPYSPKVLEHCTCTHWCHAWDLRCRYAKSATPTPSRPRLCQIATNTPGRPYLLQVGHDYARLTKNGFEFTVVQGAPCPSGKPEGLVATTEQRGADLKKENEQLRAMRDEASQ
ncbi:hypothetical protein B296_00028337 [Ensete ventricosum]|uniref:Uncharacterized protein n=1 Tax=Ensete ventricosum TaxID=4639 RepID=A0A426YVW3_ENSVE|nr:hypothetical protein B296_00028337 [Ensete ventricosum]